MIDYDEIDPSIREHIRTLNEAGYKTFTSCSGLLREHKHDLFRDNINGGYIGVYDHPLTSDVREELKHRRFEIERAYYKEADDAVTIGPGGWAVADFLMRLLKFNSLVYTFSAKQCETIIDAYLMERWDKMLEILLTNTP